MIRTANAPPEIAALTGARFVAALMVLIGHQQVLVRISDTDWFSRVLGPLAGQAMTLFFVLSGFVMWINYARPFQTEPLGNALWRFAVARFARLYPLYACCALVAVATTPWEALSPVPAQAALFVTLMQGWIPGNDAAPLMFYLYKLAPAWSVSAEWLFYILFPVFVWLIARLRTDRAHIGLVLAVWAMNALAIALVTIHRDAIVSSIAPAMPPKVAEMWLVYYSPYFHLGEFVSGCLAGALYDRMRGTPVGDFERRVLAFGSVAALVIYCCVFASVDVRDELVAAGAWQNAVRRTGAMPLIAFLLFVAARDQEGWLSRTLSGRLMVQGGEVSYSIYMLQALTGIVFVQTPRQSLTPALAIGYAVLLVVAIVGTIILAHGTYSVIERPARRWLREKLGTPLCRTVSRSAI
jgi:peptidoglycan/LPS O-acetylase OafA/YrhL